MLSDAGSGPMAWPSLGDAKAAPTAKTSQGVVGSLPDGADGSDSAAASTADESKVTITLG